MRSRPSPRLTLALAVVLAAALLAGGVLQPAAGAPTSAAALAPVSLRMSVNDGQGESSGARLTCRGTSWRATGYLRGHARAACRQARRIAAFLASAPAVGRACTQEYGGPQKARIRGTIGARTVDRRFARRDGCEIADWERAGVLLP